MNVPTVPGALPLIGHGAHLWFRPTAFMAAMNELGPLVRFRPGPTASYLVTDPALLHQVLVTGARHVAKGRLTDSAGPQIGVSLVMDMSFEGMTLFASHRRHRRAVQPAFHPHRLAAQTDAVVRATRERLARWWPGRRLRLERELLSLSNEVNARAFCGGSAGAVSKALAGVQAHLNSGLYWRSVAPRWTDALPVPGTGGFRRERDRLRTALRAALRERRTDPGRDDGDVLSALARARYADDGSDLGDEQICREMVFYLIAAAHGIGDVLPWVFHELAAHPGAERRLHQELDTVLAGQAVAPEHLSQLEYTRRTLLETLRLYPPVWLLARRTVDAVDLGGSLLPAGTELVFSTYALHRHPRHHAAPLRFDPDRWLPGRRAGLPPCAYVPFGAGPRKCIGDRLSMYQMLTVVATIASHWRLRPVPGVRAYPRARIFLSPRSVEMVCEPRLTGR
ncbi:cytochrome P450 [Streptomyces sp. NPDC046261]|uniref:cytochrome P450 n=1 Tax=Streptomyces sp. NPDC046261 TaxID=3157200 RepID=UPI0033F7F49A